MEHPNRTHTHWLGKGLMSLLAVVALVLAVAAPALAKTGTAYAIFDEETDTLTFYYGAEVPEGAYVYDENQDQWAWWYELSFTNVVFDKSFKDFKTDSIESWFEACNTLVEVKGTENVDTSEVTSAWCTFAGCTMLKSLDLSTWNTPQVADFGNMFSDCSSLETLNLASLDTSSAPQDEMLYMFDGCKSLKSVTFGNKFSFKGNNVLSPLEDEEDGGSDITYAILPTPATEYGTWWRGSGKAYTPEEMVELTGDDIAGTWTWYTGETPAKATKMYRLYNPNTGEHFYTSNVGERDHTIAAGWTDEGVGWIAPDKSNTPVYRLYNENLGGEHHYTLDANERKVLIAAGWKDEGIGWYSDDEKGMPVYREYNPNQLACNHNFTTDTNEHKTLIALGWKDEGIAWYGMSS